MSIQASEKLDPSRNGRMGYSDFPEYWNNLARYTQNSEMRFRENFLSFRSPTRKFRNFWSMESARHFETLELAMARIPCHEAPALARFDYVIGWENHRECMIWVWVTHACFKFVTGVATLPKFLLKLLVLTELKHTFKPHGSALRSYLVFVLSKRLIRMEC